MLANFEGVSGVVAGELVRVIMKRGRSNRLVSTFLECEGNWKGKLVVRFSVH